MQNIGQNSSVDGDGVGAGIMRKNNASACRCRVKFIVVRRVHTLSILRIQMELMTNLFLVVQREWEGQGADFQEKLVAGAVDARQNAAMVHVCL